MRSAFFLLLFIGLVFRILLVGNPGFEADISFWKSWSLGAIDHGIVWTSRNTNINYPPGFIYALWLMGKIYSLFADPHKYEQFWQVNNFWFLLSSKSIAIVSDIIIATLIYWFFSQKEKLKQLGATTINYLPLLLSAAFYLNPAVILDSALWGQVESFGILFTLVALLLLFYRRPTLASVLFTVGFLMILQIFIYIPLFFLFIFRYFDFKTLVRSLVSCIVTFFIVTLPFLITHDMSQVLYLLTVNSDFFPWLSLNAHNIWWIVAGARGMQIGDRITALGMLNAKTVGLMLFSISYLYCMIILFLKPTVRNLFYTLTLGIFSFFLLTTQSHERYSYPILVFLLFLYPFLENTDILKRVTRYFWILYLTLTLAIFFNMHTGLIYNYPRNGFSTITQLTTPATTIINSYLHIVLYLLLIPLSFSQISFYFLPGSIALFAFLFFVAHFSYYIKGRVYLTSYKPIIMKQDFSLLQVNKTVNSHSSWKNWNRLSNNYFFYRKGFGSHANSTLVFDINRMYSRFSTDFGVDTEAPTPATVTFKIYGDDRLLYESQKFGRFDFPGHTNVNIKGVKLLKLEITDAGDGINSDHADWLNPILYR